MKGDGTFRGFEHVGKAIFCGKVKRRKKEHETSGAEDEAGNDTSDNEVGGGGRAGRQKGWWKRGDVEAKFSHCGEPINERADSLAEKGREISNDNKRWDERTDRMTFEVRKGDTTVRSVWTNSVRNAFRKQAGRAKMQEARAAAARHWTERVWYRHNQHWLQATREGTEASKS
jgi:hypothetical protein